MADSEKRKVSAREILSDIRAGMDAAALKGKYGLSDESLETVYQKLVHAGALKEHERAPSDPLPIPARRGDGDSKGAEWQCPACGKVQASGVAECTMCGIVVAKYLALQGQENTVSSDSRAPTRTAGWSGSKGWIAVTITLVMAALLGGFVLTRSGHRDQERPGMAGVALTAQRSGDDRSPAASGDFLQRFDEAKAAGHDAQVDQTVVAWKAAEPKNPEIYVKAANYYFAKARREAIQVGRNPPEKGDFALRDKSGKVAGSMGPIVTFDPVAAARATDLLREATQKFPERLDIWFGLAYIHKELENLDAVYSTLEEAVKYAAGHPTALKWKDGRPLPKDPAVFVPEYAQTYVKDFFNRNTPQDDERGFTLAKLLAASYPKHPFPVNSIAVYYAQKNELTQAVSYFEKAHELDPTDALVMFNLGKIYADLHENAKARAYFEKVIASDAKEMIRQRARENLEKLR